jgi:hypothetical protein
LVRAAAKGVLNEGRKLLPTLVRQVLARGIELGDVRSDLNLDDMAHVVSEVFVSDTLLELAVVSTRVGRRRAEPVVETLLHGVIA